MIDKEFQCRNKQFRFCDFNLEPDPYNDGLGSALQCRNCKRIKDAIELFYID